MGVEKVKVGPGKQPSFERKIVTAVPEETAPVARGWQTAAHPRKHSQHGSTAERRIRHVGRLAVVDVRRIDVRNRPSSNRLHTVALYTYMIEKLMECDSGESRGGSPCARESSRIG